MSDAAAFFAKKKTKKKKFKAFNANTIDASAVASAQHVDAPEISAEEVASTLAGTAIADAGVSAGDDGWADPAAAWGAHTNTPAASGGDGKVAELLDMRALEAQRNEEDDIAEKLRIEETKAQLAKAKEGMAREAERLKEEKEMKEAKAAAAGGGGMGGGAVGGGTGGTGGKWVPSHLRSTGGGTSLSSRFGGGSSLRGPAAMDGTGSSTFQKPVDMANEELFPDLADADKILAEKEKQDKAAQERRAGSGAARAPTGWGSRMGGGGGGLGGGGAMQRKPLNLAPAPAERKPLNLTSTTKKEEAAPKDEKTEEAKPEAEAPVAAAAAEATPAATPAVAEKPKEKKVLKKKKKKDLSTFKAK
ncbi:hypothetical protein ACHAXT_002543 [Thalassiosira profunda]